MKSINHIFFIFAMLYLLSCLNECDGHPYSSSALAPIISNWLNKIEASKRSDEPSRAIALNEQYSRWLEKPSASKSKEKKVSILMIGPACLREYFEYYQAGIISLQEQGLNAELTVKYLPGDEKDIGAFIEEIETMAGSGRFNVGFLQFHNKDLPGPEGKWTGEDELLDIHWGRIPIVAHLFHRPQKAEAAFTEAVRAGKLKRAHINILLGQRYNDSFARHTGIDPRTLYASFHGITRVNENFNKSGITDAGYIPVVGGRNRFDRMRRWEDINDLLLGFQNQLKATGSKILLYTGPRDNFFDQDWDERFTTLSGDPRYWVLSTNEITAEMEKSRWKDIHDFKNWLYSKAQGRIIIRSDFPEKSKGDKENTLAQWEGSLVASYMELFREETKQKGLGLQIAYTGSPHKNAAGSPMIPVFLPSASAMDMVKDELLSAFLLVMKEDGTTIDVEKSVERMLTVLTDKDQLAEALEMNVQAGRYLTIEKVVWGQIQEFRKLIENLRPADSIPDGSSVRISV